MRLLFAYIELVYFWIIPNMCVSSYTKSIRVDSELWSRWSTNDMLIKIFLRISRAFLVCRLPAFTESKVKHLETKLSFMLLHYELNYWWDLSMVDMCIL